MEKAAGALNRERVALLGNHLSFTEEGHVIGISDLHKAYLIEMAQQGVPSRREAAPARELAKNHGSVRGHEDELMQKAWKDAAYGAAYNGRPRDSRSGVSVDAVRGVRVASWTSAQAVSAEGRPINDMWKRNEHGSKFNHPPAPQPRHPGVARQALWWNARHPGIPLRCAKRDVPRAFKWHFLAPRDVPEFAVRLLGVVIISLVMPFGWVGAPGEFVAWSAAAKAHHGSFHSMMRSATIPSGLWMTGLSWNL